MTQEAINNLIALRVANALAEYETQRNSVVNRDTSNTTRTGPRIVRPTRECTYKYYLNCEPLKFNGTEGIIGLTRWFERTEAVSNISNCTAENQVKFASCTLIGSALTWGKVKKLEVELWNMKVKGTDITSYTLCFQELSLLCGRMFLEESDEIERYAGGLPEMIRGNVIESIPEADIPLQKRARFTTPTSRYEIGESSVAAAARQIRPTLTIAESRRADGKLIGRLRRERRYFRTVATHYVQEVAHSRDYCARIMDYCQSREVHTSTLVSQMEALRREKMAPKRSTRLNPGTTLVTTPSTTTTSVTNAQLQAMINDCVNAALAARDATRNGDDSHTSRTGARRPVQAAHDALTWWNSYVKNTTTEEAYAMKWATLKKKMTGKYCPRGEIKKIDTEMWNLKVKGNDVVAYNRRFQQLALMCSRMFPEEVDKIEKYIGGLPDMILGSVKAS
nr:hypothetical protein [Tanacetum cinerariifolium]